MSDSPARAHLPALDGLRGVAILFIIAFHYLTASEAPDSFLVRKIVGLAPASARWPRSSAAPSCTRSPPGRRRSSACSSRASSGHGESTATARTSSTRRCSRSSCACSRRRFPPSSIAGGARALGPTLAPAVGLAGFGALGMAITLGLAFVSYVGFERHFLRVKRRFEGAPAIAPPL